MGYARRDYRLTVPLDAESIARQFAVRTGLPCRSEHEGGTTFRLSCDDLHDSVRVTFGREICQLDVAMRTASSLTYFPDQIDLAIEDLGARVVDPDAHVAAQRARVPNARWEDLPAAYRRRRRPPLSTAIAVATWTPIVLLNALWIVPFLVLLVLAVTVFHVSEVLRRLKLWARLIGSWLVGNQ